ncbi:hypothetical protein EBT31_04525 [bacterium]|nr:hypothetical protein [bacterium]
MIAHVIPLTRLPARFTFFDYHIPQGMEVEIGDLVNITFRGISLQGVVRGIAKESTQKKLAALSKIKKKGILTSQDILRLETIAHLIGQSPSSLFCAAIPKYLSESPPLPLKKISPSSASISQEEIATAKEYLAVVEATKGICALQGDSETGILLAQALAKRLKKGEQLLILVPRDRDAEILEKTLTAKNTQAITGSTKEKDRSAAFLAWKENRIEILIGTKQVALWSAPSLTHILVLQAGNDEYANLRRNPKFDPREAAKLLAVEQGAKYISIDTLPRIEDTGEGSWFTTPSIPFTPTFVSLSNRTEKTPYPLLTNTLVESIKTASQSQKKVLLFLNRKGAAKRLQCMACDQVPLCGTCGNLPTVRTEDLICDRCGTEMWIPENCPLCGKPKLKFVGVGGEKVVADLQKLFPHLSVGFVEKKNDTSWKTANIIVATEHIFANLLVPFTRYTFGLVADLMADLPVGSVDFRATEHTSRQLLRLAYLAKREKAECIIQTWIPERLPELVASKYVTEEELRVRRAYLLPPFGTIYKTSEQTLRNPLTPPSTSFILDASYVSLSRSSRTR